MKLLNISKLSYRILLKECNREKDYEVAWAEFERRGISK